MSHTINRNLIGSPTVESAKTRNMARSAPYHFPPLGGGVWVRDYSDAPKGSGAYILGSAESATLNHVM